MTTTVRLAVTLRPEDHTHTFEFDSGATIEDVKVVVCRYWGKRLEDMHIWVRYCVGNIMPDIIAANVSGCGIYLEPWVRYVEHQFEYLWNDIYSGNQLGCEIIMMQCKDYLPHIFEGSMQHTPSTLAVCCRNYDALRLFAIHYPKSINITNNEGFTPLCFAVLRGASECVGVVVDLGADVNYGCGKPLEYAVNSYRVGIMQQLIHAGASIFVGEGQRRLVTTSLWAEHICHEYVNACVARRQVVRQLMRDRTSYLGWLPRDLWEYYLDPLLYNALKVLKN